MKKEETKKIIVSVLQNALTGQLKGESKFNPQHVADAINQKITFDSSLGEVVNKEVVETIIESVTTCQKEMDTEFEKLDPKEDALLRNFIRGKSHAYQEMIDILNKL